MSLDLRFQSCLRALIYVQQTRRPPNPNPGRSLPWLPSSVNASGSDGGADGSNRCLLVRMLMLAMTGKPVTVTVLQTLTPPGSARHRPQREAASARWRAAARRIWDPKPEVLNFGALGLYGLGFRG